MEQKTIKIGNVSIDWKRAIHRVFFFVENLVLTEQVLLMIENILLRYAQENKVPLVTITGKPFEFCGVSFTLKQFVHYLDTQRPFGECIFFIRPELFRDPVATSYALALWRRSRKRGTPAFAVYTPLIEDDDHRDFEADAFTKFYFFRPGRAVPPELLAQNESVSLFVVELFPGVPAVCQKETF